MFSLSQAAKHAGVSKATIHRAIKSGKISAARPGHGSYKIDPAELSRVYTITVGDGAAEPMRRPRNPFRSVPVRRFATPRETALRGRQRPFWRPS
jgi:excisionase family DNA binding protein